MLYTLCYTLTLCRDGSDYKRFTELTAPSLVLSSQLELILAVGLQIRNAALVSCDTRYFLPRRIGRNIDRSWRVCSATLAWAWWNRASTSRQGVGLGLTKMTVVKGVGVNGDVVFWFGPTDYNFGIGLALFGLNGRR